MSIGLFQLRDHRVVQQYEDHYMGHGEATPCPACGAEWTPRQPDGSRSLTHAPHCDWLAWLNEPDEEDLG
jgi:hypothetical protein